EPPVVTPDIDIFVGDSLVDLSGVQLHEYRFCAGGLPAEEHGVVEGWSHGHLGRASGQRWEPGVSEEREGERINCSSVAEPHPAKATIGSGELSSSHTLIEHGE